MRRFGVTLFAVALWLSLSAFGQYGQPSDQQGSMSQDQTGKAGGKLQHVKGKISDDGKTLIDKDGKSWTIENPDAVKGHEGHEVSVRGHVDASSNSVHVMSLKMAGEHASKKKDTGAMSEQPPQPPQQ